MSETESHELPSASKGKEHELPTPSFEVHISALATQAIACMGYLPQGNSDKDEINLPLAKHLIDTVAILEEKTKGNLTNQEAALIENALHQLRLVFVSATEAARKKA
jgi:uncharacterized membrane protein YgcG